MTTPFDFPSDWEPQTADEETLAAELRARDAELAALRAQAEAPEAAAVEQPAANIEQERQDALDALGTAKTEDERRAATARLNEANAQAYAQKTGTSAAPLRPVNEVMSPDEARELAHKLSTESSSSAEYIKKLQAAGLAVS